MFVSKAYIALPIMNEPDLAMVMADIAKQTYQNMEVFVCVNQAEVPRLQIKKDVSYLQNQKTLLYLQSLDYPFPLHIIDKSSEGKAWTLQNYGVGMARKTLMDAIVSQANFKDVILSMDADTHYPCEYVASVMAVFNAKPKAVGLANPYFHPLVETSQSYASAINKAILRYEIYMRTYAFHLGLTKHPYSFTAIGSAMALPVWAYCKIGGLSPHKSGEDFYLFQKLAKIGPIETFSGTVAYPSPRASQRVCFGTGPAVIKGMQNDWKSYPIYPLSLFQNIEKTYQAFARLYTEDISDYPLYTFLSDKFGLDWYRPLRKNAKTQAQFQKNCVEKLDALRSLQYLKASYTQNDAEDSKNLQNLLNILAYPHCTHFDFTTASVEDLDQIRCFLAGYNWEMRMRNEVEGFR
ncbi:MAG: hypothetical protein RSC04_01520 [Bacteroidales bacterium]